MNLNNFSCPLPKLDYDTVQIAHGAGGKLSEELIRKLFLPCFGNPALNQMEDQAILPNPAARIAFSTDTFVVQPIFFPGGTIGELAVNGTVNDLAVGGARPLYLSTGFVIEEGLPIEDLHQILLSMKTAADKAGVQIVTGDTKVVPKGACDKIFINTSGIGLIPDGLHLGISRLREGMELILSGSIADHGMAVMTKREGLSFESAIISDTAALNGLIQHILTSGASIAAMRDPTRGGLATTLNEWASGARLGIKIKENSIPIKASVSSACEVLGIDPLFVANEGKIVLAVESEDANRVIELLQTHPFGRDACRIGHITAEHPGQVLIRNAFGVERIVSMPIGEQLPRIC